MYIVSLLILASSLSLLLQRKITSYFPPPAGFSASAAPSTSLPPSTNIKSKRLRNVVTRITGTGQSSKITEIS